MLARVDSFLLDKAQKFCDRFQRLTGFTKFRIEKWLAISQMFLILYEFVVARAIFMLTPLLVLVVVFTVLVVHYIERQESAFLKNAELDAPSKGNTAGLRLSILAMVVLTVFVGSALLLWSLILADAYISLCIPRPPSKSKMREWLEKGLQELNSLLPEPAPIRVPAISD